MQGVGAALRRTVPGCAPFAWLRNKPSASWRNALAAGLLIGASGAALAADSVTESSADASMGMIYVDSELAPTTGSNGARRAARSSQASHPIYHQLAEALAQYRENWGGLPQLAVEGGASLRPGAGGERVRMLRERLGLVADGSYDAELEGRVRAYQSAHGLPADGVAGRATLESLNLGAAHYERLIRANVERARALPAQPEGRYLLVDTAAARLWMYEDGRPVDSMRVIVGKPNEQTPMLAAYVRYAVMNPYWNVPPDLVQRRIAPNVLDRGLSYLDERGYEVLANWRVDAPRVDPATIDWSSVAAGRREVRVRQRPGPGNMMGEVKFMMSDELGIYLHDTPDRSLFAADDRQLSSGCVRLEDARRLSQWLLGDESRAGGDTPEQRVNLPEPVPVFITYLTAMPSAQGLVFREDVYGRDRVTLANSAP